jgi:hypothetical protein
MWEPFYTTKPEGLGLGLAICREILLAHASELRTERKPAGGMIFSFTLRSTSRETAKRSERLVERTRGARVLPVRLNAPARPKRSEPRA